jgi:hypothetical protein
MATRCSAVANRRTLTPDYYSRKKLTVTSIAFVRNWRVRPPRATPIATAARTIEQIDFRWRGLVQQNPYGAQMPMEYGFLPCLIF